MNKKQLGIKTLKYPLWFDITFFCLTVAIPIVLVLIEGMKAPDTIIGNAFKFSFVALTTAIVAWFFIQKFWLKKIENKLLTKQIALEHDYSIDNGNLIKIKYLWFENEQRLALFNMITTLLYGGLPVLILMGVASSLMTIRAVLFIIMAAYAVAFTIKFMLLLIMKGDEYESTNTTSNK